MTTVSEHVFPVGGGMLMAMRGGDVSMAGSGGVLPALSPPQAATADRSWLTGRPESMDDASAGNVPTGADASLPQTPQRQSNGGSGAAATPGSAARRSTSSPIPSILLSAERLSLERRLVSLPEQVAALSQALQRSNENLRNCHLSLRDVMTKDVQYAQFARMSLSSMSDATARGTRRGLLHCQSRVRLLSVEAANLRTDTASMAAFFGQEMRRMAGEMADRARLVEECREAAEREADGARLKVSEISATLGAVVREREAERQQREKLHREMELLRRQHEEVSRERDSLVATLADTEDMRTKFQEVVRERDAAVARVAALEEESAAWRERYRAEMKTRRAIFNELQELRGNVRVFCRVRPLTAAETAANEEFAPCFPEDGQLDIRNPMSGRVQLFEYDSVFRPEASQEQVYKEVEPYLTSVLDGYHACIFAYGQTGSGKTYTMDGGEGNWGVNLRTLDSLFRGIQERAPDTSYSVSMSVLEIYNEQVRDLLATAEDGARPLRASWDAINSVNGGAAPPARLEVRQGAEGVHVPGLTVVPIASVAEAAAVLAAGRKRRATFATNMNEHSSRSHCLVSVTVSGSSLGNGLRLSGKLVLVDLAGSERLSKSEATGERLKEAQNINKSLSALGDVINALASKSKHVPYRNSTLTYLLSESLGGNGKTLMVVQVSPAAYNTQETICSLSFAARARGVETGPAQRHVEKAAGDAKLEGARQDSGEREALAEVTEAIKAQNSGANLAGVARSGSSNKLRMSMPSLKFGNMTKSMR